MVGDIQDILGRIKAVLPRGWFADVTPVLDSILSGASAGWSFLYSQLALVKSQGRLSTASGFGIDLFAADYFGPQLPRMGASDNSYRARITKSLLRPQCTRAALAAILTDMTGRPPTIFEPLRPADTGAYSTGSSGPYALSYSVAGAWGSPAMPFQAMVIAYRPPETGIPIVAGWGAGEGSYGMGAIEYATPAMSQVQVADQDIFSAIASVAPIGTTLWARISN